MHAPKLGTMMSTSVQALGFGEVDAHGLETHSKSYPSELGGKTQEADK